MVRFRIQFGKREIDLPGGELIVGRGLDCHIRLDSPSVSRRHLRLLVVADSVIVYDLDSHNGTWVNGKRITGPAELQDGDQVRVATQTFSIKTVPPEDQRHLDEDTDTFEAFVTQDPRLSAPSREDHRAGRRDRSLRRTKPAVDPTTNELDINELDPDETVRITPVNDEVALQLATDEQRCTTCSTLLPLGVSRCPVCGAESYSTPTYRTCPGCRALVSESDRVCPRCGLERPYTAPKRATVGGQERRSNTRRELDIRALYVSSSLTVEDDVINISSGGLFIVSDLLDPVGTRADVILYKGGRGRARIGGEVVHVISAPEPQQGIRPGMGIRFTRITPAAQSWLIDHLKGGQSG